MKLPEVQAEPFPVAWNDYHSTFRGTGMPLVIDNGTIYIQKAHFIGSWQFRAGWASDHEPRRMSFPKETNWR